MTSVRPHPLAACRLTLLVSIALGSAGIDASVSDSFSGIYNTPIEQSCDSETCPPLSYSSTPFTCTANLTNTQLEPNLVIQWIAQDNLARERYHGYYDPTRPGALSIGLDFLLTSDALSAKVDQSSTVGEISPNCPSAVNVFENRGVEEALLSDRYPETPRPANRAVFLPLDTLIHKGRATSTFTGPAVSATGCCTGTTKMTLTMTAKRV